MSKKIVIASVLKPTDDVRAYWKIAQSMAKTNKYEVNIIGNKGKSGLDEYNIYHFSHLLKRNEWTKRILIRELLFLNILKIKPNVLVITTYELITTALLVKLFSGCKVIYDVQENYAKNATLEKGHIRKVISLAIQFQEWIGSLFIDHYWLAEACYKDELAWLRNSYTIIENKAQKLEVADREKDKIKMLFSGTISRYGGAHLALKAMIQIIKIYPTAEGVLIGQIHDQNLEKELKNIAEKYANIQLLLSKDHTPHTDIIRKIQWANLGIISYQENEVNRNKIPTKLYEYTRYNLPFLIQANTTWHMKGSDLGIAIPVDFSTLDLSGIQNTLKNSTGLSPKTYPDQETWEYESKKMIDSIDKLIK